MLEDDVDMGPFSHLRPGSYIERGVHLGNFCEVKNSRLGQGSAMGHFGYVGDATVGADVNLGAGAVTCNYDGVEHQNTVIEDGAFIGSGYHVGGASACWRELDDRRRFGSHHRRASG